MWNLKVVTHGQTFYVIFEYGVEPVVVNTNDFTYQSNNVRVTEDGEVTITSIAKETYGGTYNCTAYTNINGSNQTCGTTDEFKLEVISLCKCIC